MRSAAPRVVVRFTVNGVGRRVRVAPMARLLDVLREECGLTGTKEGCGEGECGACTVLVDGAAVDACLVPVAHAAGTHVTTIEGAGRRRAGRALQRSFERHGAAQCGICTPGMIVAAMPIPRGSATAGDCRGAGRQPVPVHRLRQHLPRRRGGRAAAARPPAGRVPGRLPVAARRSRLTLARPRRLRDALRLLAGEPLTPIAGCTDVYVGLQFGAVDATAFLDLWGLDELRGICAAGGGVRLGALTTYTEIRASRLVQARVPMLAAAAAEIGGAQIQNRGTLGGNLANASPAGDTLPVLLAADASLVLQSATGERTSAALGLLHRLPAERPPARRADRGDRDSAPRRPAVVAQGGHASGPGHLQGDDGRRARRRRARRHRRGGADRRAGRAGVGGAVGRPHRSPRRKPRWPPTSRRSTTCARRRSTAAPLPPTCWPASGVTRHDPVPVHGSATPAAGLAREMAAAATPPLTTWISPPCAPGCRHRPLTRFAPAPTGYLHLGHVVNAMHVWGLAQALDGRVLLRVEDHDRQRCRPEFEAALLDDLDWLGLRPRPASRPAAFRAGACDGRQSDRDAIYRAAAAGLAARGLVYGCRCTRRDLEAAGAGDAGELRYPGTCRQSRAAARGRARLAARVDRRAR